jgi:hypothetical protein
MKALKQPTGAKLSARGGGRGSWGVSVMMSWIVVGLLIALLTSARAAGQAAPAPSPPDPCQMAPNLPYCR